MKRFLIFLLSLPLAAQTSVGGKVALGGSYQMDNGQKPVISALSVVTSANDANSVVLSWTTDINANTSASCGGFMAPHDALQNRVTAHEIAVPQLSPSNSYTCQACSSGTCSTISASTNANATSTPITGVSLGPGTKMNSSFRGDLYFPFTSNDGITYLTATDSTGFSGTTACSFTQVVGKFTNLSTPAAADVNTFSSWLPGCTTFTANGNQTIHSTGFMSLNGAFIMAMGNQVPCSGGVTVCNWADGVMMASTDKGLTWNNQTAPGTFTTGGAFNSPYTTRAFPNGPPIFDYTGFVTFGADDGTLGYATTANRVLNANAYVYFMSGDDGSGVGSSCANTDFYLAEFPGHRSINSPSATHSRPALRSSISGETAHRRLHGLRLNQARFRSFMLREALFPVIQGNSARSVCSTSLCLIAFFWRRLSGLPE